MYDHPLKFDVWMLDIASLPESPVWKKASLKTWYLAGVWTKVSPLLVKLLLPLNSQALNQRITVYTLIHRPSWFPALLHAELKSFFVSCINLWIKIVSTVRIFLGMAYCGCELADIQCQFLVPLEACYVSMCLSLLLGRGGGSWGWAYGEWWLYMLQLVRSWFCVSYNVH